MVMCVLFHRCAVNGWHHSCAVVNAFVVFPERSVRATCSLDLPPYPPQAATCWPEAPGVRGRLLLRLDPLAPAPKGAADRT